MASRHFRDLFRFLVMRHSMLQNTFKQAHRLMKIIWLLYDRMRRNGYRFYSSVHHLFLNGEVNGLALIMNRHFSCPVLVAVGQAKIGHVWKTSSSKQEI